MKRRFTALTTLFAAIALILVASRGHSDGPGAALAAPPLSPEERAAADGIRAQGLRADVRFLASDLLEGRGPASTGDRLAQAYIAARMEAMGLSPGAPDGTFYQPFDVVSVRSHSPETVMFRNSSSGQTLSLRTMEDVVTFSNLEKPEARIENAEVVFVGYGIQAPEYRWDDFKGVDLKGKVLLMMNSDPARDPALFAGETRLYYGRWTYKYESAARAGAAGAILIHTTPSAGYPWQVVQTSWSGEEFGLPSRGAYDVPVKGWATEEASRRLAKLSGQDLDALRARAELRDFAPVPLGITLSLALRNDVERKQTGNVIGKLPGSDPNLSKEAVLYTAHHDHLGVKKGIKPGSDTIYNGAQDNASGVAQLLAIAQAARALPLAPRRTLYFAAVGAEEQGLLGSLFLAQNLPVPAGRVALNINMDGGSIHGRTKDLSVIGLGKSEVDDWIRALAALQGRAVVPDPSPDKGYFYRSDQFSFAKLGIPAAYCKSGQDVIGRPAGWGKEKVESFLAKDYHQPSDELREDWDFSGMVEDCQLLFLLGTRLGNAPGMPKWRPGDEFEAARHLSQRSLP